MEGNSVYTIKNFKTKKELKDAIKKGDKVCIFAPGFGTPKINGSEFIEGPHYPACHTWYAQVEMKDGFIIKVK
jgi:hypothetical protein